MPSSSPCSSLLRRNIRTSLAGSEAERTLLEDEARADETLLAQVGSLVVRELDLKKGRSDARALVGSVEKEVGGDAAEVAAEANALLVACDGLDDIFGELGLDWALHAVPALV